MGAAGGVPTTDDPIDDPTPAGGSPAQTPGAASGGGTSPAQTAGAGAASGGGGGSRGQAPDEGGSPAGTSGERSADRAVVVEVRRATAGDVEELLDLVEAVAAEGRWLGTEAPIDRVKRREILGRGLAGDEEAARFVAVADGRIVGSIDVHREATGVADLGMAVADGWRGRGVGRQLMDAAVGWARSQGTARIHKLALQAWPHNAPALGLYRRFGFVTEGTLVRHYRRRDGSLWDAVVMGLVLDHASPGTPDFD